MRRLTAGASSHLLVEKLARAGWGNLAGPEFRGVRSTLAELTRMLDPRSGQGKATVYQVAERTGYSTRWTARCLGVLEQLDLIEWHRGGVVDGNPVPSYFRVSKRALLVLVSIARDVAVERVAEHTKATRERIAAYRLNRTQRGRKRRSPHVEVTSTLPLIREVPGPTGPREQATEPDREALEALLAETRARIRAARGSRRTPITETAATTGGQAHGDVA